MISHLRGNLLEKNSPSLVIDVQGVGYEVEAPLSTCEQLPELNQAVHIYTHLAIRDDAHTLYGFASTVERRLFRELIKVNGVGAKLALAILSAMDVATFIHCIQDSAVTQLTRISGVGKKTAERLVVEMRDRLDFSIPVTAATTATTPNTGGLLAGVANPTEDAISALIALGYKAQEASRLVNAVKKPEMSSEELIRHALKSVR